MALVLGPAMVIASVYLFAVDGASLTKLVGFGFGIVLIVAGVYGPRPLRASRARYGIALR